MTGDGGPDAPAPRSGRVRRAVLAGLLVVAVLLGLGTFEANRAVSGSGITTGDQFFGSQCLRGDPYRSTWLRDAATGDDGITSPTTPSFPVGDVSDATEALERTLTSTRWHFRAEFFESADTPSGSSLQSDGGFDDVAFDHGRIAERHKNNSVPFYYDAYFDSQHSLLHTPGATFWVASCPRNPLGQLTQAKFAPQCVERRRRSGGVLDVRWVLAGTAANCDDLASTTAPLRYEIKIRDGRAIWLSDTTPGNRTVVTFERPIGVETPGTWRILPAWAAERFADPPRPD